jgi:hypothetical protein
LRAQLEGKIPSITVNFLPGACFDDVDRRWTALPSERPAVSLQQALATMVKGSVTGADVGTALAA